MGNLQTKKNPQFEKPFHSNTRAFAMSGLRENYGVCMTVISFHLCSAPRPCSEKICLLSWRIYWHKNLPKPVQYNEKIINIS
jgi:hypothetical protein